MTGVGSGLHLLEIMHTVASGWTNISLNNPLMGMITNLRSKPLPTTQSSTVIRLYWIVINVAVGEGLCMGPKRHNKIKFAQEPNYKPDTIELSSPTDRNNFMPHIPEGPYPAPPIVIQSRA